VHAAVDVRIIFYVGSNLELKYMEKDKTELPWGDFFSPARRACGRRFNWGGRGWRALPKNYKCFVLAASTEAFPHQAHSGAPARLGLL
jgi:hypothetical protein